MRVGSGSASPQARHIGPRQGAARHSIHIFSTLASDGRRSRGGYEVVDPPAGADQPTDAPGVASDDLFLYPKNGQTAEQQSADRYECHSWAKSQTGFDPTRSGGGVDPSENADKRVAYQRAMTACLEARGYSVK
jgi:hypothetical protein